MMFKFLLIFVAVIAAVRAFTFGSSNKNTIAVLGANGRTGTKVVSTFIKQNTPVRAITRKGVFNLADSLPKQAKTLLTNVEGDVTDLESLKVALAGASACVFAASASKEGGSAAQVDKLGLINVAKACIDQKVKRLVIVSSGAVSKPLSPVYILLNIVGKGIMKAKFEGENEVRKLYAGLGPNSELGYTIVRPGGLTEEEPLGVKEVELNQGDDRSGRISRWDVAALCIESIKSKDAKNTTFECYNRDTSKPLTEVGLNNILKKKAAPSDARVLTGKERNGSTYPAIFKGLTRD